MTRTYGQCSITISEKTKNTLVRYGHKSSSWDSILQDLIQHVQGCDKFWVDRT